MDKIIEEGIEITKYKTQCQIKKHEAASFDEAESFGKLPAFSDKQVIILIKSCDKRTLTQLLKAYDLNLLLMIELA